MKATKKGFCEACSTVVVLGEGIVEGRTMLRMCLALRHEREASTTRSREAYSLSIFISVILQDEYEKSGVRVEVMLKLAASTFWLERNINL